MSNYDLKILFHGLQKQMVAKLEANREFINHPVTKGDASEVNWIEWLRNYLPKRYSVDKAFIIDCINKKSDQIDLVIYDRQYSPFVFNQDSVIYIPAESVYAVFEVKQELNKSTIEYAGNKAESVRNLVRTSGDIHHAGGRYEKTEPKKIISGILTLSSSWVSPYDDNLTRCLLNLNEEQRLDLGCALFGGSFYVNYDLKVNIENSIPEESLIFFFLKLLGELQKLGTVTAMDINRYASALESAWIANKV